MSVIKFPSIGKQVDDIIAVFWREITNLPDDTSVSAIIAALHIVQFDVTEQMRKKEPTHD